MPLSLGSSPAVISQNIREFHTGKTYAKTAAKFGKDRANKQAVAVALSTARGRAGGGLVRGYDDGGAVSEVINALSAGSGLGGPPANTTAQSTGLVGDTNTAAPSSPMQSAATSPPAAGTSTGQVQSSGVANNPVQQPFMASGGAANRSEGGFNVAKSPHLGLPWQARNEIRQMHTGPVLSAVPGRTDHHPVKVPSGSYVVPADIVSGRGQGNTIAGSQAIQRMFKMGPYGTSAMPMRHGAGAPRPPHVATPKFKSGGKADNHIGVPTDVNIAGGEVVIPPGNLMKTVHPDLNHAHRIMDAWVLHERKKLRETLAKLPGPARD